MSLEQIKQQYKHLAESIHIPALSESEEEEWQQSIFQLKNKRKHKMHVSHLPNFNISESEFLSLKQKIAQCISTIGKKNNQIQQLKEQIARLEETVKFQTLKNTELVSLIQRKNGDIVEEKAARRATEEYAKLTQLNIQNQQFDKQLLARQVTFYQNKVAQLNKKLLQYDTIVKELKNQIKFKENIIKENQKLQIDMKRLKGLLSQTKKYKNIQNFIQNKHFIQQKLCEKQNWISDQLIANIQKILQKYNPNSKNKQLSNSLVAFINKYSESMVKDAQEKVKKTYNSRIKQIKRVHNYSYFLNDYPQSYIGLKKTFKTDKQKRIKTTLDTSIDTKIYTQTMGKSKIKKFEFCIKILNQLRSKLCTSTTQMQLNTDKINIFIDWAIQCITNSEKELKSQTRIMSASKASKAFTHML